MSGNSEMSTVYNSAPPTAGQVTLHTSHGDIVIALWSKECPIATRNFVQLCLEGYYDKTIFHRVVCNKATTKAMEMIVILVVIVRIEEMDLIVETLCEKH